MTFAIYLTCRHQSTSKNYQPNSLFKKERALIVCDVAISLILALGGIFLIVANTQGFNLGPLNTLGMKGILGLGSSFVGIGVILIALNVILHLKNNRKVQLSEDWKEVGKTIVSDIKTQQHVPLVIREKRKNNFIRYAAFLNNDTSQKEESVGYLTILLQDNHVRIKTIGSSPANQEYRGIGTQLIQVAIEVCINNFKQSVEVDAIWNSHGFFYKKKFRCKDKSKDNRIEQIIENKQANTSSLGQVEMYLPSSSLNEWKLTIQKNRILNKSNVENSQV